MDRRYVVGWILGSLILAVLFISNRDEESDTRVYRTAAVRYVNGQQIYRPSDAAAFTYPPFFVFAYMPFAALPKPWDRVAWCFVNLLLLGYILRSVHRLAAPTMQAGAARTRWPMWVAQILIGLLALRFIISPIEYQGHDLIVFALLITGLVALGSEQSVGSGSYVGLAAACKATPLLMLVPYFWQQRWRALAACVLVAVTANLLPDLLVANPDRPLWAQSWYDNFLSHVDVASAPQAHGAWSRWNMLNQSLSGTLYRLFTRVTQPQEHVWNVCLMELSPQGLGFASAISKLLVVALVSYAVWPARWQRAENLDRGFVVLQQGAAVVCGMLLLSPMSSKQHFCVLLIPITVLVSDWLYHGRSRLVAALLAATFVLGTLAGKDVIGATAHRQLGAYGSLTWCTLIYLIGCCDVARRARQLSSNAVHLEDASTPISRAA